MAKSLLALVFSVLLPMMASAAPPEDGPPAAQRPILIGLNADLSAADAPAGEAIRRGALVAIDEINAEGGVLGRPLALETRDHRRNPARGVANTAELAADPGVVAILGGKHTPVILAELRTIHEFGIPYLIPWAAGTPLVENEYQPNFVFRLSVRDELAASFLVRHARQRGFSRLGLLLEQTGWGRSNERALVASIVCQDLAGVRTEWFNWGQKDFSAAVARLREYGADVVVFVGNAPDGVRFLSTLAAEPESHRLPVISHWGIAGGDFADPLGDVLDLVDLTFLQTFSFLDPPHPERAVAFFRSYQQRFGGESAADIHAPTGTAHAYDLTHLLAKAIRQAGDTDRHRVRDALETLGFHAGLVRDYDPPFTRDRHEALDRSDFRMARFSGGRIVPLPDVEH